MNNNNGAGLIKKFIPLIPGSIKVVGLFLVLKISCHILGLQNIPDWVFGLFSLPALLMGKSAYFATFFAMSTNNAFKMYLEGEKNYDLIVAGLTLAVSFYVIGFLINPMKSLLFRLNPFSYLFKRRRYKKGQEVSYHVDHIFPRSLFPHLCLEPRNLQILCNFCNIKKSNHTFIDYRGDQKRYVNQPVAINLSNHPTGQKGMALAEIGVRDDFYSSSLWRKQRKKALDKYGKKCMNKSCPH
jgi:hypothetical protein